MKFWARVLINLGFVLAAAVGLGAYGRYGFVDWPVVDGLELTSSGFRVGGTQGDWFSFGSPMRDVKPKSVDWQASVYQGADFALAPSAIRTSGFSPGVELYFPLGFRLDLQSTMPPFLSWDGGTVDMDNPTAPSRWVLISLQDGQAPVLLVFSEPVQLVAEGRSGDWKVRTWAPYKGWVRVIAPQGGKKMGVTVGALGEMVAKVKAYAKYLVMEPVFVNLELKEEEGFVTAVWNFDGPGAMVPPPLMLCKAGGYEVKMVTGVSTAGMDLESGPVRWTTEPRIAVKFPCRRVPVGRSVAVGVLEDKGLASASGFDLPGVVETALMNLTAGRDRVAHTSLEKVIGEYGGSLQSLEEPWTKEWAPLGEAGQSADLMAAQAFAAEVSLLTQGKIDAENGLFDALASRMDWTTWRIWVGDQKVSRRATALFATAGGVSPVLERRFLGCMAQAGFAAQTVLPLYQSRRGFPLSDVAEIKPLQLMRAGIFEGPVVDPFFASLLAQVRVLSSTPLAVRMDGKKLVLSWIQGAEDPRSLVLLSGFPIAVEARKNLAGVVPSQTLGFTSLSFSPKEAGECEIALTLPDWAGALPKAVPVPRYTE